MMHRWPDAQGQARAEINDLFAWKPVLVDGQLMNFAWKMQDRYRFSFWDSLIVAAAKHASCTYLLTENLQSNQDLDGLLTINPFLTAPEAIHQRD